MYQLKSVMPVLRVTDLDRAVRFYVEYLGFRVVWRAPNDGDGENCMLQSGSIDLLLSTGSHLGHTPTFTGTLYFNLEGVETLYLGLKDRVPLVWPLEAMSYGTLEFAIRDPDGYTIALAESSPEGLRPHPLALSKSAPNETGSSRPGFFPGLRWLLAIRLPRRKVRNLQ
jgi:catechol 2,3-dioxygenase-like lactoylglutathione lyase family enzyme